MSSSSTIEAVRRLHRLWSTGEAALIEQVYAPDFVGHWPPSSAVPTRRGRAAIEQGLAKVRAGFPDWREDIQEIFESGDKVACRFIATGTHLGPFAGLEATGRRVEIHEISTFHVVDGLVREQWCAFDELARLKQLGVSAQYLAELLGLDEPILLGGLGA